MLPGLGPLLVADRPNDGADPAGQDNGLVTETADQPSASGAPTGSSTPEQPTRRRTRLLAAVAVAVLAADLLSKVAVVATLSNRGPVKLAGGLVYLVLTRNSGAAFSVAQGATGLFTLIAAVVIAVILRTTPRLRSAPWAVCLGLILGGAGGNLVDRLFRMPGPLRGQVVDWISLLDPAGRVWPVFNLADAGIVSGGVLAVLLALLGFELTGGRASRPPSDDHR